MGLDDNGVTGTHCFIWMDLSGYNSIFFSLFNNDRIIQPSLYQSHIYFSIPATYKRQEDAGNNYGVCNFL
jgi:hypothetical protein